MSGSLGALWRERHCGLDHIHQTVTITLMTSKDLAAAVQSTDVVLLTTALAELYALPPSPMLFQVLHYVEHKTVSATGNTERAVLLLKRACDQIDSGSTSSHDLSIKRSALVQTMWILFEQARHKGDVELACEIASWIGGQTAPGSEASRRVLQLQIELFPQVIAAGNVTLGQQIVDLAITQSDASAFNHAKMEKALNRIRKKTAKSHAKLGTRADIGTLKAIATNIYSDNTSLTSKAR